MEHDVEIIDNEILAIIKKYKLSSDVAFGIMAGITVKIADLNKMDQDDVLDFIEALYETDEDDSEEEAD